VASRSIRSIFARRRGSVPASAALAVVAVLVVVLVGPRLISGGGSPSPSAAGAGSAQASASPIARASVSPQAANLASASPSTDSWTYAPVAPSVAPIPAPTPVGTFSATGSMTTQRGFHTATRLQNGLVLIAGGLTSNLTEAGLASAELYDPHTGTFRPTGSMSTGRYGHTATLLADGRVLIVGGDAGSDKPLASAELYDPATGTFSPTGSMATPRADDTATLLLDGRVLITGGDISGYKSVATAELYDPAAGTFNSTGSMSTPRVLQSATLLADGKVLIAGGGDENPGGNPGLATLASAELYDPQSGKFSATGSMITACFGPIAVRLPDGRVLMAGGGDVKDHQVELYDPGSGTFAATGSGLEPYMGSSSSNLAVLLMDGRVLLLPNSVPFVYDPETGTLSPAGPTIVDGITATLLADGRVLVTGGAMCSMGACQANDAAQLYTT